MPQEILIKARSLSRSFGRIPAVADVGFDLARGEALGFLGPNGAGKSTTLEMICGCLAPSAGRIEIAGIDLLRAPLAAKRRLGYLPQTPPLYGEMDVEAYLRFCARLHGVAGADTQRAVQRVAAQCGLGKVLGRRIEHLSMGMQQRVGIAQALVHDPDVVVLDEPTTGLDPIQISEIRELVRELARERAVLMSSHILPEVEAVCSRVLIINQGRLVHDARIDADDNSRWLRLGLEQPPGASALGALDGVTRVVPQGDGEWLLQVSTAPGLDARLLETAVANGWRPYRLSPERSALEQVFLRVTAEGEAA